MKKIDGAKVEWLIEAHRAAFNKCVRLNIIIGKHKERLEMANNELKVARVALAEYINARSGFSIIQR